jgi:hypothetical protein
MVQKCIDESPTGMAGGRVHDHPGRFVHNEKPLILEDHIDRDLFRDREHRLGWRDDDHNDVAYLGNVALLGGLVGDADATRVNQRGDLGTGKRKLVCKIAVDPLTAGLIDFDPVGY